MDRNFETDHPPVFKAIEAFDSVYDIKEKLSNLTLHDGIVRLGERVQTNETGLVDLKSKLYESVEVQSNELKALREELSQTKADLRKTNELLAEYQSAYERVLSDLALLKDIAMGVSNRLLPLSRRLTGPPVSSSFHGGYHTI